MSFVKESYAFIECLNREERLFIHASQLSDREIKLAEKLELSFNVATDEQGKSYAVRAAELPAGTVKFVEVLTDTFTGLFLLLVLALSLVLVCFASPECLCSTLR